ncbi:syndecan-1 isoform X2 [Austrofundulus limnaeus]|uniref:Syndecan-1 isoform X2 n=1 Tax=Austrofundulus limnaeus TaxID=52670 RepID=A0A2I4BTS1_AUSLI|nr:PREDICTED: syndecan-1-like isoform X2 [Austrofundulus limnaeus]
MRLSLAASLVLAVGLMQPVSVSLFNLPEDLEGSGSDQEGSGSGAYVEIGDSGTASPPQEGNKNSVKFSDIKLGSNHEPPSGTFVFGNSRSFLENKQILAGAIAGGVTGAALGTVLSAILIYKWRRKQEEECILGTRRNCEDSY